MNIKNYIIFFFSIAFLVLISYFMTANNNNAVSEEAVSKEVVSEEAVSKEVVSEEASDSYITSYLLFFSLIIAIVSLAYNLHLVRLRNFWEKNNELYCAPEKWAEVILSNNDELNKNSEELKKMISIFSKMRSEIDTKEKEIERYKKGYDKKIFKDFLLAFIKVSNRIDTYINKSNNENQDLNNIKLLMDNAIENCGVTKIDEKEIINKDFRELSILVSDNVKIIETNEIKNNYLIKEILEDGYKISGEEEEIIIKQAKVSIYLIEED